MRNILALLVFIPLQILFIPLAIVGAIWVGYKQLIVSKRLGVSQGDYQHALASFVTSEGLTVGETYFMGHKTEKGPWMVVAELKVL